MSYFDKYNKYKQRYLNLKNQIGGNPTHEALEVII